jgi:hypothetical protein
MFAAATLWNDLPNHKVQMQHKKHKNKGHTKHAEAISSKHKITKQH